MKRLSFYIVALLILLASISVVEANTPALKRISGTDEIETSVEVSKVGWDNAEKVVISRVDEFPDALSGAVLAHKEDSPILLTYSDSLSYGVKNEIERLGAIKAIILGGEMAISSFVENELQQMGLQTKRIGGDNRYETAELIAKKIGITDKAIIACGENFPDALAVAPYGANYQIPILLTLSHEVPNVTQKALENVQKSIIVGGPAVISDDVKNQLPNPLRIAGNDRFGTAANILEELGMPAHKVYLATGLDFPYALIGSVLAAKDEAPLLLTRDERISTNTAEILKAKSPEEIIIIGEPEVKNEIEDLLGKPIFDDEVTEDTIYGDDWKYIGEIKDGEPYGEGTLIFEDGEIYEGELKEGLRHGYGTNIWPQGDKYTGEWENDLRNGQGTNTYASGDKYVGDFNDNLRHGYGIYTWSDGAVYEGNWENDRKHGQGILTFPDGSKLQGEWLQGEFFR